LYFLRLSLRNTSKTLEPFVERSYVALWYWINEEFDPKHLYPNKRKSRITAFIIDETQIQIGPNEAWLWVAVEEPIYHRILGIYISRHRGIC
jgi:putative transposase